MPIYEYLCNECGEKFEKLRSFSAADDPISCSSCSSSNTKRALSVFNAKSDGRNISGTSTCGSCAGGSCGSCSH